MSMSISVESSNLHPYYEFHGNWRYITIVWKIKNCYVGLLSSADWGAIATFKQPQQHSKIWKKYSLEGGRNPMEQSNFNCMSLTIFFTFLSYYCCELWHSYAFLQKCCHWYQYNLTFDITDYIIILPGFDIYRDFRQ